MINYKAFNVPASLKWLLLNNTINCVLLYNKSIICIILLPIFYYINTFTKSIQVPYSFVTFETSLCKFLQDISLVKLILLKYKGKGFRLIKNKQKLDLLFNFAHLKYLIPRTVDNEKIAKSKIVLIASNRYEVQLTAYLIKSVRVIDQYTKNGIRFKRQLVFRRKGKTLTV